MATPVRCAVVLFGLLLAGALPSGSQLPSSVPRTWDDERMADLELPLARPEFTLQQVSSDYYYRIPIRPVYRTYPVYARDREPAGYMERLAGLDPVEVFDPRTLKTEEDWIRAGELVFDTPILIEAPFTRDGIRHPRFVETTKVVVAPDGTLPYLRYIVRAKGKVELGGFACGMCHTRVMPDGTIIKGAQGNFPGDRVTAFNVREQARADLPGTLAVERQAARTLFQTPWTPLDVRLERWIAAGLDEFLAVYEAIPPGVFARHRASVFSPPQLPDLIGVQHRRYLDRTGIQQQRDIADLMRYAALNQGADDLGSYGGFIPAADDFKTPPAPTSQLRYSDEQLYALARYVYSLKPPQNPNRRDAVSDRGEAVFRSQGCPSCHTPPYYTSNKLLPAPGFNVPAEHRKKYDVLDVPIGTDPTLTLQTRRGSGYYKVPSLLGVWYRGPFEHNGSIATLEDWFDAQRLRSDYVPTGWTWPPGQPRTVPGHEFGLRLTRDDKRALIAFLRTL